MGGCHSALCTKDGKVVHAYQLNITTRTTIKPSTFLFDINDSNAIVKQQFKVSEPGYLIRKDTEITFVKKKSQNSPAPTSGEIILDLKIKNKHLAISKPIVPRTQDGIILGLEKQMLDMPWILARRPLNKKDWKGIKIRKGDIIRFGRIKFRIKDKNLPSMGKNEKEAGEEKAMSDVSSADESPPNMDTNQFEYDNVDEEIQRQQFLEEDFKIDHLVSKREAVTHTNIDAIPQVRGLSIQTNGKDHHEIKHTENNENDQKNGTSNEEGDHGHDELLHHDEHDQNPENLDFGAPADHDVKRFDSENKACRICLWDDEEEGDPIIQPCKCAGTMKNVHVNCFKSWIGKKIDRKETSSMISVFWKRLQCEICKTEVSHTLEWRGKYYTLVDVPTAEAPNLVLEYFHNERILGFHIVKFLLTETKKMFGRGSGCEIRVHDNTVSRVHGQINLIDRQFYLQDLNSKYGTYLLLDETRNLMKAHNPYSLQVGRTIIDCQVLKVKNFVSNANIPKRVQPRQQQQHDNNDPKNNQSEQSKIKI